MTQHCAGHRHTTLREAGGVHDKNGNPLPRPVYLVSSSELREARGIAPQSERH